MSSYGYESNLETDVLCATPIRLITLLFDGAIGAVREAERCGKANDPFGRGQAISKACAILVELSSSLDLKTGGEMAQRLLSLYEYIYHLLLQAHAEQNSRMIVQAEGLLETLASSWRGVAEAETERDGVYSPLETVA